MKVLVVHNDYRSTSPSGENVAVRRQVELLRDNGVEVSTYLRSSDELDDRGPLGRLALPVDVLAGPTATRELAELLAAVRPDVVHLHNVYPLISPRVVSLAHDRGIAVVATAHNYRRDCVKGTFFRDGHDCRDCVGHRLATPAIVHACYHGSTAQSAVMAIAQRAHRSRFGEVDRWIALTPSMADYLATTGIPAARVSVVPNVATEMTTESRGTGVLFAGRLVIEKGIELLAAAYELLGEGELGPLVIAGDGPARDTVTSLAARRTDVTYAGLVGPGAVRELVAATRTVVVPSLWADVCPLIAIEALAAGRPVVATANGGLPWIVGTGAGVLVDPTPEALVAGLRRFAEPAPAVRAGQAARERFQEAFSPAVVAAGLRRAYEEAVEDSGRQRRRLR